MSNSAFSATKLLNLLCSEPSPFPPFPNCCTPRNLLKRYDDTDILTQEFVLNHVDSRRGCLAIQRLNFIHAQYNIPNPDLLYTLSLFVLEPIRLAQKFGYRNWTEGEKRAQFVVWHDIGKRMGIKNIPESLEEMEGFSRQYEALNMEFSESNRAIGDATLDLLLSKAPALFRPFARGVAYALCDERLVKAMGYPPQPYWFVWSVEGMIRLCGGVFLRGQSIGRHRGFHCKKQRKGKRRKCIN